MNRKFWAGKKVVVTGHTGFKGGWLCLWLAQAGARVGGYGLAPDSEQPSFYQLCDVSSVIERSTFQDIRDQTAVTAYLEEFEPDIVIHMAAQALVRNSYQNPVETFETNVLGTVNLLEAVRRCPSIVTVVNVTTDKCYENRELLWGYREYEPLGGSDPYSASKACSELVTNAYRCSFFNRAGSALLATARAGNVIGGGDWSRDRILPDFIRSISSGIPLLVRNPEAVRPWQHVLDALNGYIVLAEWLGNRDSSKTGAWNFGPPTSAQKPVRWILDMFSRYYGGEPCLWTYDSSNHPLETRTLRLDSSKASQLLNWHTQLGVEESLRWTAAWYREVLDDPAVAQSTTLSQIESFERLVSIGTEI
jgi:CDP-glucose 4,6-dehydratase